MINRLFLAKAVDSDQNIVVIGTVGPGTTTFMTDIPATTDGHITLEDIAEQPLLQNRQEA